MAVVDTGSSLKVIKQAVSHGAAPTGIIAAIAGFFSDFVKPMINLVPFFFVISLAAALVLWFGVIARGKQKEHIDTIAEIINSRFGVFFGITVISTAFWLLMIPVFALTPPEGALATAVPQVGAWQEQLMGRLDVIDAKLDQGFSEVLSKIDSLDKNAGVIANPQSYNDFYHNARVQELTGDMLTARKSYEKYFESNLHYIDPWYSYTQILKSLEGPSSVPEFLAKTRDSYPDNPAAQLAYALSKVEREDKAFLLDQLASKYSDYGPIFLAQLELYSYKESGVMTLAEQKKNQEALGILKELMARDGLSKFFIDQELLGEKEEFIKSQQTLMDSFYGQMVKNPLNFNVEYMGTGAVSMTFVPAELVKKIYYRIDGEGEFKDTGSMGISMVGSPDPLPNYGAIESLPEGDHFVEVKYLDSKGQESPIAKFDLKIEPVRFSYMGYKIQNPYTGKAAPYIYYSFYGKENGETVVRYSFDEKTYDQTGDGMIFLDSLEAGKHSAFFQVKSSSGKVFEKQLDFEIS